MKNITLKVFTIIILLACGNNNNNKEDNLILNKMHKLIEFKHKNIKEIKFIGSYKSSEFSMVYGDDIEVYEFAIGKPVTEDTTKNYYFFKSLGYHSINKEIIALDIDFFKYENIKDIDAEIQKRKEEISLKKM